MYQFKDNQEKMLLLLGFVFVFFTGAFSGYFYFQEQGSSNEIIIEEASQDCRDLFNAEIINNYNSNNNSVVNSQAQIRGEKNSSENITLQNKTGIFVASKNSKIYHLFSCQYTKRIKEENKVYFKSKEEASRVGYDSHKCVE